MDDKEWREIFVKELARAEKELAGFKEAVAKYRLRVYHRDLHGERDMTEQNLKDLESAVEEYRRVLRDD